MYIIKYANQIQMFYPVLCQQSGRKMFCGRYGYIHIDEIWLYTYRRDMVIYISMIYGYIHIDEIYIYEYNTNIVREVWVKVNWLEREREREREIGTATD